MRLRQSPAATQTAVAAALQKNYPHNRFEQRPGIPDRRRACDVSIDARFFVGECFCKAGLAYSGGRGRVLSLFARDDTLFHRPVPGKGGLARVKSHDASAARHLWYDCVIPIFCHAAAHSTRVCDDDPIPFADIYQHHRNICIE